MAAKKDWPSDLRPILKRYKGHKHPLMYHNTYQLLVMVILAAQSADEAINALAPALFKAYPEMGALARANPQALFPYISKVRNFAHKANWLTEIAKQVKRDADIPLTLDELVALPGIGRKSANVILREAGRPAEGVVVDLHTIRVATRLGITKEEDAKKIEQKLMTVFPRDQWDVGMALSFHGREICRPKPNCPSCPVKDACAWYKKNKNKLPA